MSLQNPLTLAPLGGGSVAPYQALKNAGLDMASPAPYQAVIKRMDGIMDEMEALLAAR